MKNAVVLALLLGSAAAAAAGFARPSTRRAAPSLRITDVRPLFTSDVALRSLITHTFAVRVAIAGWRLLPYEPGVTAADNRAGAGHWRLYLDGHALADNLGSSPVTYVYLTAGLHWLAAELSNADATSLEPPVWSEPVVLHVPRVIRCWQTGWHASAGHGVPRFRCLR